MTNREKIEFLYKENGIRNEVFLNDLLHDDFVIVTGKQIGRAHV